VGRILAWLKKTYVTPWITFKRETSGLAVAMFVLTFAHGIILGFLVFEALLAPPLPDSLILTNQQFALILFGIICLTSAAMFFGIISGIAAANPEDVGKPHVARLFCWVAMGTGATITAISILLLPQLLGGALFSTIAFACSSVVGILAFISGSKGLDCFQK